MQLQDSRIVSGSWDDTVRIWPFDGSAPTILKGHISAITCLAQPANGRIASGSEDCTVRIWGKGPIVLFQRALGGRTVVADSNELNKEQMITHREKNEI